MTTIVAVIASIGCLLPNGVSRTMTGITHLQANTIHAIVCHPPDSRVIT
jgi:hypothetical protein